MKANISIFLLPISTISAFASYEIIIIDSQKIT